MEQTKKKTLKTSLRKLVYVVSLVKEDGYQASSEGLGKILSGRLDGETLPFQQKPYFAYWPSLSKKKIKGRVTQLVRHGYLANNWVAAENDYFLSVTPKGQAEILGMTLAEKDRPAKPITHSIIKLSKGERK
jgi:uncharacterized protein YpbB